MRRALILAATLAACGAPPAEQSDWERKHEQRTPGPEAPVTLPAYPARERLIEFPVTAPSEFRFFIDPVSLSVGDGVVRYVLVARSPSGIDNVTFEGMHCSAGQLRIYAIGRDGAWAGKPGEWRAIDPRSVQRWHSALYREYFCPLKEPIANRAEGLDALRRGGHPVTRNLTDDIPRGH